MPDLHPYEYAIIRLVPVVEREEFLNIGVILYSKDERFLQMRTHLAEEKIHHFAPQVDITEVRQYLEVWEWICAGEKRGGKLADQDLPNRFRWLTAVRSTIIQSSRIHSGRSQNPDHCLTRLFAQYVC